MRRTYGWLAGLPVIWAAISLLVIPLAVYVISYLPWAAVENHQIIAGFPSGHTGQTLLDLTNAMYGYHNGLVAAHPADSPWWAWLFDLKPVWFYQGGFAGGTAGAIYDAGNLVLWWMGVPAMLFVSVMAPYAATSDRYYGSLLGRRLQVLVEGRLPDRPGVGLPEDLDHLLFTEP